MNSLTYKISYALAVVSNWLYRRALTSYISKQQKLIEKNVRETASISKQLEK